MRKIGDRRDARLLRDIDPMHYITPILYPNRADNEAFISERIDLTKLEDYLQKKNRLDPDYHYSLFQLIVTAVLKTLTLRPEMNRFVANRNLYQRNTLSAAFVVKKKFADGGAEGLAFMYADENDNVDTIHKKFAAKVNSVRGEKLDASSASMALMQKLPRFISKTAVRFICMLDRYGKVPQSMIASDPYYSSVILTNLGSIDLHSGYHHLTNWGTTSVFVIVGKRMKRPFYDEAGNMTMRDSIDLGLTIDERIADGYYYSKTVAILKKLLENPELLEIEFNKPID